MPSGVSSFGSTMTSSSPMLLLPASEGVVVGEEICVDENLGELEEAGEADSERGDGRFVDDVAEGPSTSGVGWRVGGERGREGGRGREGEREGEDEKEEKKEEEGEEKEEGKGEEEEKEIEAKVENNEWED